jgi:hypothetical protein
MKVMTDQSNASYGRLHVWGLTVASGAAALLMGLLALPLHLLKHVHEMREPMMRGPMGTPPGMGYPPQGMMQPHTWHAGGEIGLLVVGLILLAVWGGIAGAVVAAVYNALLPKSKG